MKLVTALAATAAFGLLVATPAAAQDRHDQHMNGDRHDMHGDRHDMGMHRGGWHGHGWGHHRHCRWTWRHHHRVRSCW